MQVGSSSSSGSSTTGGANQQPGDHASPAHMPPVRHPYQLDKSRRLDTMSILDEYSLWPHGFVGIATLRASLPVLRVLSIDPLTVGEVAAATAGNEGHLAVALRTLAALGWVETTEDGMYTAPACTVTAAQELCDTGVCSSIYSGDPGQVFRLAKLLNTADGGWTSFSADGTLPAGFRKMLAGAVLVPLLMALRAEHMEDPKHTETLGLTCLDQIVIEMIAASFELRGMCASSAVSNGSILLTQSGTFVLRRCGSFGVALSYWPMLKNLEDVLFGDAKAVFAHDADGHELHVDRTMNVIGSGFMHGKYFEDMMSVHVHAIFDKLPLDQQPSIVADTGCGDGTLLLQLFTYVRDHTKRGPELAKWPLLMVGVDFNEAPRIATAATLRAAGVPFETMFGDIGDPEAIHAHLCHRFGARDKDDILHVRSFLDHDRPFIEPVDKTIIADAIDDESDATYTIAGGAHILTGRARPITASLFRVSSPVRLRILSDTLPHLLGRYARLTDVWLCAS